MENIGVNAEKRIVYSRKDLKKKEKIGGSHGGES